MKKPIVTKKQSKKPTTLRVAGFFDLIYWRWKFRENLDCGGKRSKGKKADE
jgi:hypothetical protein